MIPWASTLVPIMNPGTSWRKTSGNWNASQIWMKCAPLSAASMSRMPPSQFGWLATMPTGRPPKRARHVMRLRANLGLMSSKSPSSTIERIGARANRRQVVRARGKEVQILFDRGDALGVVLELAVPHPAHFAVDLRPSELLLAHLLPGDRLHQGGPAERHRADVLHHRHVVGEPGDVRGARGSRPHHRSDLRY